MADLGPGEPKLSLEQQYSNFGMVLSRCEKLIPEKRLEIWERGLDGTRVDKQKEFKSEDGLKNARQSLETNFSDPKQQEQIIEAASSFLNKLAGLVDLKDRDTIPFGQLDRFLVGFPQNMIDRLGKNLSAETIVEIFKTADQMFEHHAKEIKEDQESGFNTMRPNKGLGTAALLIGEAIPEVIANSGANQSEFLTHIGKSASMLSSYRLVDKVESYKIISEESQNTSSPDAIQSQLLMFED